LYQKKVYYNFCFSQEQAFKPLKDFSLKRLIKFKKKQQQLFKYYEKKNLNFYNIKSEMGKFYLNIKNYILLNFYTASFDYFIKQVLSNMLNPSKTILQNQKKLFNFLPRHHFFTRKVLKFMPFSCYYK
jgi:hypothetical protein